MHLPCMLLYRKSMRNTIYFVAGVLATGLLATGISTAWAGMGSGGTGASGSSGREEHTGLTCR